MSEEDAKPLRKPRKPLHQPDVPLTAEYIAGLRKQIERRMNHYPESRARAKAERKAALQLADELLQEIEVYERMQYDNLIGITTRQHLVKKIRRILKLE